MPARFTAADLRTLGAMQYQTSENADEESYAYCAQLTEGPWKEKADECIGLGGFSTFYPHYFIRINKCDTHFTWFAGPRLQNLNPRRAEFLGIFRRLDIHTLIAIMEVVWEMEKNPLPDREDFEIQRMPVFVIKH